MTMAEHAAENPAAYRRTAEAVISNAIEDFNAPLVGYTPIIRRAVEAGAFLLERTDAIVPFWFRLADIDLPTFRSGRHAAALRARLAAWRQLESQHEAV